jgi:hypothetical protein
MPVAGGNVEAFLLRLDGDRLVGERLVQMGVHRPLKHFVVDDPTEAVRLLKRGETIYLQKLGNNLDEVKRLLKGEA